VNRKNSIIGRNSIIPQDEENEQFDDEKAALWY
jgi:hypothetical protein